MTKSQCTAHAHGGRHRHQSFISRLALHRNRVCDCVSENVSHLCRPSNGCAWWDIVLIKSRLMVCDDGRRRRPGTDGRH